MSDEPAIYASVLGVPTVTLTGERCFIESLNRSRDECESGIPGLRLARRAENVMTPSVHFHLRMVAATVPRIERRDGTYFLAGDSAELTAEVWSDLLRTLSAHALARRAWFFIEASAILWDGVALLMAGTGDSGQAAAAAYLGQQGKSVLSTGWCLIDESLHLLAGTRVYRMSRYFGRRYFPAAAGRDETRSPCTPISVAGPAWPPVSDEGPSDPRVKIGQIYHLQLHATRCQPRPVASATERMVLASHTLSRPLCHPAMIPPWQMILPDDVDPAGLETARAAIVALAQLPHLRARGRLCDLAKAATERPHE